MIKLVSPETLFYIFFTIAESLLSHLALDVRSGQLIVYLLPALVAIFVEKSWLYF